MLSKLAAILGLGPRIVQFNDGKFGVRTSKWPYDVFQGRDGDVWCTMGGINKYCKYDTYDEAVNLKNKLPQMYKVLK